MTQTLLITLAAVLIWLTIAVVFGRRYHEKAKPVWGVSILRSSYPIAKTQEALYELEMDYFRQQIYAALRVPHDYLGQGTDLPPESNKQ